MMTFFVIYTAWVCPGGWFSGYVPPAAKPLICQAKPKQEPFDKLYRAQGRAAELGQAAAPSICWCHNTRCTCEEVEWETKAKF